VADPICRGLKTPDVGLGPMETVEMTGGSFAHLIVMSPLESMGAGEKTL